MSGMSFMGDLLSVISDRGRALLELDNTFKRDGEDLDQLVSSLLSSRGEASGTALAKRLLDTYQDLDDAGKTEFLLLLVSDYGPDLTRLTRVINQFTESPDSANAILVHQAAEAKRQELLRRLNKAPGGTQALVAMRKFLLGKLADHPELKALDADFLHLFTSWFNRGFLVLRRIDWNTPAVILEKIIRYEAVHEIDDWEELRRRIDSPDRRCYAFFHPALIDEPLIFVEVALMAEIPNAIDPILAINRQAISAKQARAAVFYSISNCQAGLRGISFGNFLIKQVVDNLRRDLPQLDTFVTLSPVIGFLEWLRTEATEQDLLTPAEQAALDMLRQDQWYANDEQTEQLQKVLLPLAATFFHEAKSRNQPADPVARFHLGNGARLERINWLGDKSDRGMQQAAGLMVNYLYAIQDIEKNHEAFASRNEIICSTEVGRQYKSRSSRK